MTRNIYDAGPAVYQALLILYDKIREPTKENFLAAAHTAYGWMPTIPAINYSDDVLIAFKDALNKKYDYDSLSILKTAVNNSIVGVSKMLHFYIPDYYPIWDSRVARTLKIKKVNDVNVYIDYIQYIHNHLNDNNILKEKKILENKWGYKITPVRAFEFILYRDGAPVSKYSLT